MKNSIKYIFMIFLISLILSGCGEKEISPEEKTPTQIIQPAKETVSEEKIEEPSVENQIELTAAKTMVPDFINIKKGETVRFVNKETNFNHNLIIYPANVDRPMQEDLIAQSGNIGPGNYWEFVFEESGEYTVKDIYSSASSQVTAEVVREIGLDEEGVLTGKIKVS